LKKKEGKVNFPSTIFFRNSRRKEEKERTRTTQKKGGEEACDIGLVRFGPVKKGKKRVR